MPEQEIYLLPQEIERNVANRKRAFIKSLRRYINPEDPRRSQWAVKEQFKFWQQNSATLYKVAEIYQYLRPVSEAISQLTLRELATFGWEETQQLRTNVDETTPGTEDYDTTKLALYRWQQIMPMLAQASDTNP